MNTLRAWIAFSWVMLVATMAGGALLLRRTSLGDPSSFDLTWIRAFHAHGGVLLLMSILYFIVIDGTALSARAKRAASAVVLFGTAALAAGFSSTRFLASRANRRSAMPSRSAVPRR